MTRRAFLPLTAALSACSKKQPSPDLFPVTAASGWRRTAFETGSSGPDPVPRSSIRQVLTARYEGPGKLEARAYELTSAGVALDLVQRWKPSADTVFFYRDNWFVVVKWQEAERAAVQAFVRDVEKRLDPQSGTRRPL